MIHLCIKLVSLSFFDLILFAKSLLHMQSITSDMFLLYSACIRMDSVSKALEEVLTSALLRGWVTIGVYETAKALNV